jgi:hypothetical protein
MHRYIHIHTLPLNEAVGPGLWGGNDGYACDNNDDKIMATRTVCRLQGLVKKSCMYVYVYICIV